MLTRRAADLAPRRGGPRSPGGTESTARIRGLAEVRDALDAAAPGEEIDSASLIDAISDPGPAASYSYDGFRRLRRLGAELSRLRSRLSVPLPDLVADLERVSGLDVEVRLTSPAGRAHLDAFADVVAEFAATGGGPLELVEYLLTAAEREDGLAPGEVVSAVGRVQVLTVHAAKGLEWQIVAVPHLSDTVFPGARGSTWLGDAAQLPPAVRGDGADLPQLSLPAGGDQKDMVDALTGHADDLKAIQAIEERRLLYVAVTRAEQTLLTSGHHWGRTGGKPHGPSGFLLEIAEAAKPFGPAARWDGPPDDGAANPMTAEPRTASWPQDPLGERRPWMQRGADLVLRAIAGRAGSGARSDPETVEAGSNEAASNEARSKASIEQVDDLNGWARDVEALLAERRSYLARSIEVSLPQTMSATALVELASDAGTLARRIRRPVPHAPTPEARRGTTLHAWLERFFTASALLEISDLPGASENGLAPDPLLERLKSRFRASAWASRVPFEVELPFSMTIAGQPIRGRVDAVFRDDDGGCTVVDWKTGRPPAEDRRFAVTVQLAVYRLAVSEILGLPLAAVRAAFVYVGVDQTFAPTDLLDAAGLVELIRTATSGAALAAPRAPRRTISNEADADSSVAPWVAPEPPDAEDPAPSDIDFLDEGLPYDELAGLPYEDLSDRDPTEWATVG